MTNLKLIYPFFRGHSQQDNTRLTSHCLVCLKASISSVESEVKERQSRHPYKRDPLTNGRSSLCMSWDGAKRRREAISYEGKEVQRDKLSTGPCELGRRQLQVNTVVGCGSASPRRCTCWIGPTEPGQLCGEELSWDYLFSTVLHQRPTPAA